MITSPYNFVPLSHFVYFPDWADHISHDIPFTDGVSGTITCQLEAITPIYVRNGGNWEHKDISDNEDAQSFFKVGNEYIIPGTSIKGILRNVLEIISFGKLGKTRVDDHPYSIRDLNYKPYTREMTDDSNPNLYKSKVQAGWLEQDKKGAWYLTPCDYSRVEQRDLIKLHGGNPDLQSRQNSEAKYLAWQPKSLVIYFDYEDYLHKKDRFNLVYKKAKLITFTEVSTKTKGNIVFTGQPGPNKHMEFIFFNPDSTPTKISDDLQEEFLFIHRDSLKDSDDWKFWQSKLDSGQKIPVFYLGSKTMPTSMGLAQMYRLPYTHSILKTIEHTDHDHLEVYPDLADTIFGFIDEKGKDGLKGRASIGHALADTKTVHVLPLVKKVLATPKPTYYPNYIKQSTPVRLNYTTMMDTNSQIRGWKRYPARKIEILDAVPDEVASADMATAFIPLKAGATFSFPVRFHNLKPAELGAIIWALTWGGKTELCHSLGMAKPFGYGQVRITVTKDNIFNNIRNKIKKTAVQYMADFVEHMKSIEYAKGKRFDDWENSEQLEQLKAMANPEQQPHHTTQRDKLKYMRLTVNPNRNEFKDATQQQPKLILEPHINYTGRTDAQRFNEKNIGSRLRKALVKKSRLPVEQETLENRNIAAVFNEIKNLNDKGKLFRFFQSLQSSDIDAFNALDLTQVNNVLNIGTGDELIALEMNDAVKQIIVQKILQHIKPTKKWDQNKRDKYERLKSLATATIMNTQAR